MEALARSVESYVSAERPAGAVVWVRLASAGAAVGVATALVRAEPFLIEWGRRSGERVAYAPSLTLVIAAAAAGALGAVLAAWAIARAGVAPPGRTADALGPWQLLWMWALPFAPWLPDQLPWLLVLAAPIRWALAVVASGLTLWEILRFRPWPLMNVRPAHVLIVSLVLFATVGTYVSRVQRLGGDEPHYLIITQSLLADHDLAIENNHAQDDYRAWFPIDLPMHYLHRGRGGVIYSVHAPGLPAALVPAYALGGARGAILFVTLLVSLAALAVFLSAREAAGTGAAIAAWATVCLSMPFFMQAWLLFPEAGAAVVTASATWWVWQRGEVAWWRWGLRGLALGWLPWLHAKFSILLAGLAVTLAWRLVARRRFPALAALVVPIAVSLAAWFAFFYALYGVADPTIPYGGMAAQAEQLSWNNLPRGTLGLLVDQEWGLLTYAPAYLLAAVGVPVLLRRGTRRADTLLLLGTIAAFVASTTRYYMWWGGWSIPARFLVPVLPLAAPFVAEAWIRARSPALRGAATLLIATGIAVTIVLVAEPSLFLMFNDRDGSGKLAELLGGSTLVASLPTLLWENWTAQWRGVTVVFGTIAIAAGSAWTASRRGGRAATGVCAAIAGAIFGGAVVVRAVQSRDGYDTVVQASRATLLNTLDPARHGLVNLTGRRATSLTSVLPRLVLRPAIPADGVERPVTAFGPLSLPPGTYDASVWFRPGARGSDAVLVTWYPGRVAVAKQAAAGRQVSMSFRLPRELEGPPVWVGAESMETARAIERVDIVPRSLVPPVERGTATAVSVDALGDRPGAALAYLDGEAFAEGGVFWTRGDAQTDVLIIPGEARRIRVTVQSGAAAGDVRLTIDGAEQRLSLPAQATRHIAPLDLAPGRTSVPLRVAFDAGFRPAEHNSASRDRRYLGCRVYVEVE